MLGRFRNKKRESEPLVRQLFHGVELIHGENACQAVKTLAKQRFLSDDAPLFPLPECDAAECRCGYYHFDDRRTDNRRETDDGLPPRSVGNDRRAGVGRRISDD